MITQAPSRRLQFWVILFTLGMVVPIIPVYIQIIEIVPYAALVVTVVRMLGMMLRSSGGGSGVFLMFGLIPPSRIFRPALVSVVCSVTVARASVIWLHQVGTATFSDSLCWPIGLPRALWDGWGGPISIPDMGGVLCPIFLTCYRRTPNRG